MNFWPRLLLDDWEKRSIVKYSSPKDNRRGVLRRMYPGFLELTPTQRLPTFNINIARRSKVFAVTFAGDVERFRVSIYDSAGEQFLATPIHIAHLQPGYVQNAIGNYPTVPPVGVNPYTSAISFGPHVFNPAITLRPNQTLTISGLENEPSGYDDASAETFRVDFTFHVWEYPGMDNGPL